MCGNVAPVKKIDKRHVEATIIFAISNVPQVDQTTLEMLLELVNATGNFGNISPQQLLAKMRLLLKYVPTACADSLLIVADLLGLCQRYHREKVVFGRDLGMKQ